MRRGSSLAEVGRCGGRGAAAIVKIGIRGKNVRPAGGGMPKTQARQREVVEARGRARPLLNKKKTSFIRSKNIEYVVYWL